MEFRLFNTKISITFLFASSVALALVLDRTNTAVFALVASVLHECGHLIALKIVRCSVNGIVFMSAGARIDAPDRNKISYVKEALVLLSGPMANILTFLVIWTLPVGEGGKYFAAVSLVVGSFNLLPIDVLDGGQLMSVALLSVMPYRSARIFVRIISIITVAIICVFALIMTANERNNFSLLILSVYLLSLIHI